MENIYQQYLRKLGLRDTYSQACQDLFVLDMLSNKQNGFYFEVGASHPFESSNTFLLQENFHWNGYSIEIDEKLAADFNAVRNNTCIVHDATTLDYRKLFDLKNFPRQIDYLSLDIEPAANTLKALEALPLDHYRFSVITYEHEFYMSGPECMEKSRSILKSKGYELVVENVICAGRDFEDWYVDPTVIEKSVWEKYKNNKINFKDVFNI